MSDTESTGQTDKGNRGLVGRSVVVGSGTLLSRLTGVVRVQVAAAVLGQGLLADTYNRSNSTPNIVYELVLGGVLTATLVPLFVDAQEREDRKAIDAVFGAALVALIALAGLALLLAPWITALFSARVGRGDQAEVRELGTLLVRCFAPQIVAYGITALATAWLNARRRFALAAFAPVANNIVVIGVFAYAYVAHRHDMTLAGVAGSPSLEWLLGVGTTAGIVAMAIVLVPPLRKQGVHLRPSLQFGHPAVRKMMRLSGWTFGYVIANQVALAVVIVIAGRHAGDLTAYQYAFIFFQLPHGLFAVSIMTALAPEMASAARRQDRTALRSHTATGLRYLVLTAVVATAGYLALSQPIVSTLLRHGRFGASDVQRTADALTGFAIGLVPFSTYLYLMRVFYAAGDTRTPFLVNCLENLLNIAIAPLAYAALGVRGLAMSYGLAYALAAVVLFAVVGKRIGAPVDRAMPRSFTVMALGGVGAGLAGWGAARSLADVSSVVQLVGGGLAVIAVYALVLVVGRVREATEVLRPLTGRLRR